MYQLLHPATFFVCLFGGTSTLRIHLLSKFQVHSTVLLPIIILDLWSWGIWQSWKFVSLDKRPLFPSPPSPGENQHSTLLLLVWLIYILHVNCDLPYFNSLRKWECWERKVTGKLCKWRPTAQSDACVVKVTQSCLFATPWTIQPMEFSRPEYWSG